MSLVSGESCGGCLRKISHFCVGDIEKKTVVGFIVRKINSRHVPSVARGSMGKNIIRESYRVPVESVCIQRCKFRDFS